MGILYDQQNRILAGQANELINKNLQRSHTLFWR